MPPPRPVTPAAAPVEESGLARAARAVADAVAGLVTGPADEPPADGRARSAASGLRDVVGAVATAVGSAFGGGRGQDAPGTPPPGTRSPGTALGDLLAAVAPRLPIRDGERLRRAHPGATDAEIADALVARAAKLTGAVGAATGGLSAAHWFLPPSLLTLPLELGAETVLVAAVEVVLVGELHELAGRPSSGESYLASWSAQRSVDRTAGANGLLTGAALTMLRRRIGRRLARGVPAAAPFLVGAALAGRGNRRATETLAERMRRDLFPGS
ncbi:hypothetical protein [Blastococcus sp. TF02A-30]|uniref:hypothetical protein n=1 Tax=Blastococcus sp. TF02A-30 TaxID=2250580 RepID=UPI001F1D9D0B|nr:hypothetical protein [Blastococcus sp. TF02A-30]